MAVRPMMLLLLVLGLAAVTLVSADPPETNAVGPFPKCNYPIERMFAAYWDGSGKVVNILKLPGTYKVLVSTTSKKYEDVKCRKYSFDPLQGITAQLDSTTKHITVKMEDGEDSYLRLPKSNVLVLMAFKGVIITYQCSTKGPEVTKDNQGDASILISDKADSTAIKQAKGLMSLLGFTLDKKYDC